MAPVASYFLHTFPSHPWSFHDYLRPPQTTPQKLSIPSDPKTFSKLESLVGSLGPQVGSE